MASEAQRIVVAPDVARKSSAIRPREYDLSDSSYEYACKADFKNAVNQSGLGRRHLEKSVTGTGAWKATFDKLLPLIGTGFLAALIGPRGTGKTQLAAELIVESCKPRPNIHVASVGQVFPAKYMTALQLFLSLRATYRDKDGDSEMDVLDKLTTRYGLVVIDEVQERGNTDFEDRMLTHIVDRRYANLGDTLLISNLTADQFALAVGPSVVSRANEAGGIIVCDWPSFREASTK